MTDTPIMDDMTISEVVNMKAVASTITESANQVLLHALAQAGIVVTEQQRAQFADEIGKNAAMLIGLMEITLP